MASPPNPMTVPIVTYEYLFCLPSSEQSGHPFDRRLEHYYRCRVPWVLQATSYSPANMDTTQFPPVANDCGTKYPILDMVPQLLVEGEGPPT
jgi:hypothetical protein